MNNRSIAAGVAAVTAAFVVMIAAALFIAVQPTSAAPNTTGPLNTNAIPENQRSLIPWLEQAGTLCSQISAPLLAAQIQQESGWNPDARSRSGAEGISQFLPTTWPAWARNDDSTGHVTPFNPADSIMAQGRYMCALATQLAGLAQQTGIDDVSLALAGYNAGVAAVIAAHGVPPNNQTPNYVTAILAEQATYTLILTNATIATPLGLRIVAAAQTQLGVAYSWAGGNDNGPTIGATGLGYDCSGLVMYAVYQASGGTIQLPHSSETDATLGQPVNKTDLAPGDAIAFALSGGTDYDHIGIYLGAGKMIDAPTTGSDVRIDDITTSYWQSVPWAIRSYG